jgi:hypothetical protein
MRRIGTTDETGAPQSVNILVHLVSPLYLIFGAFSVVHGGLLVARGKEKGRCNLLYSNTRSSPYKSLATPLLPVCVFSRCKILGLIFSG